MADNSILPKAGAPLVDQTGRPTRAFYSFFNALVSNLQGQINTISKLVKNLALVIAALGGDPDSGEGIPDISGQIDAKADKSTTITGLGSIQGGGDLSQDRYISLDGDVDDVPGVSFYGSPDGNVKGWTTFSDNFTPAVDVDDNVTLDLATVADAGDGILQRTAFDAYGRKTGTSAATTTDLTEGSNLYFTNARSDARITLQKGVALGLAPLGSDGKINVSFLPAAVLGQVSYQGTWDASAGTPPTATPEKGWYYIVTVAGSTDLDGITDWDVGDWAIYNGASWDKIDNTDAVVTVNGYTGAVTLTAADVGAATSAQGAKADSAVQSVVAGTNVTVDNTDPQNPVISATGGGGSGDVVGPASATDGAVPIFDGTTGKLLGDGVVLGSAATTDASDYALVGQATYTQAGAGAVLRDASSKALELASPEDYGAAGDGATDDTSELVNAIAGAPELRLVGDYLVTALSNEYGVPLRGQGRVFTSVTGGLRQINSDADDYQHMFGQEYLYAFHTKLMARTSASMLFSGDSTTEGGAAQATSPYLMHELVQRLGATRGHKLTSTNGGHSSKDTADWVSTYLTSDLSTAPDLYVVRWGINDPFDGRSLADFKTSLRAGLAQCRSTYTVAQMSILLMVPNSTSDTPNNRDERWYEQVRKVCRQAARDYQCAFLDTYALWKDSRGAAGLWMDNAFGDGRAIHPLNMMNGWISSKVASLLYPEALDLPSYGSYVPTLTAVANVSASTPQTCQWMRVGNVVTVSGRIDIMPTAAAGTFTHVGISLPIASNFTGAQLGGAGGAGFNPYVTALITADTTNDRASFSFYATAAASKACVFSFTYQIL